MNANNKYGPWKAPYITVHEESQIGEIVAAAKMGQAGRVRHFKIWLGNPDCTDLNTWPVVTCRGKSAFEYRFSVGEQQFAWRRTRNKQLGSQRKDHRDFKLIAFDQPGPSCDEVRNATWNDEKCILDMSNDEAQGDSTHYGNNGDNKMAYEKVIGVYCQNTQYKKGSREAKINFFVELSKETELWCLAAVLGLQEKISQNQKVMMLTSLSYGGWLWWLGNYM